MVCFYCLFISSSFGNLIAPGYQRAHRPDLNVNVNICYEYDKCFHFEMLMLQFRILFLAILTLLTKQNWKKKCFYGRIFSNLFENYIYIFGLERRNTFSLKNSRREKSIFGASFFHIHRLERNHHTLLENNVAKLKRKSQCQKKRRMKAQKHTQAR